MINYILFDIKPALNMFGRVRGMDEFLSYIANYIAANTGFIFLAVLVHRDFGDRLRFALNAAQFFLRCDLRIDGFFLFCAELFVYLVEMGERILHALFENRSGVFPIRRLAVIRQFHRVFLPLVMTMRK